MPQNEKLQALLQHARLVCLVKMEAVEKNPGTQDTAIQKLHGDYYQLFGHLHNKRLWENPIDFDSGFIASLVLKVDACDPAEQTEYIEHSQKLLDFLKDDLLEEALERIATTDTSMWNIRMLNALRITLQQEEDRIAFFNEMGEDLDNNPEFQQMSTEQLALVAVFRELLSSNTIESDEAKVNNMKTRGEMIGQTTELPIFFRLYKKLTAFIKAQVEGAIELPDPVDPPSPNNQQALQVLIPALLVIDQKVDFFESQGVDLGNHAAYQAETQRHPTLLVTYRAALEGNTIEASESDITNLQQTREAMEEAIAIDMFVTQFAQLNTLMETATANLS